MAILQSGNLSLDIKFNRFESEWIVYDIKFLWHGQSIINDEILKKEGKYWGSRDYSTFIANDYERSGLIDTIKLVLETNNPEYWEPIEPDIIMGIYPDKYFPFLTDHWVEIKDDKNDDTKKLYSKDNITIITLIDTYNLKDCKAYSGEGISLHMIVSRDELKKFLSELESEYDQLKRD